MLEINVTIYMCSQCTRVHSTPQDCIRHERHDHDDGLAPVIQSVPYPVLTTLPPTDDGAPAEKKHTTKTDEKMPRTRSMDKQDSELSRKVKKAKKTVKQTTTPNKPKKNVVVKRRGPAVPSQNNGLDSDGEEHDVKPQFRKPSHCKPCGRRFFSFELYKMHIRTCVPRRKHEERKRKFATPRKHTCDKCKFATDIQGVYDRHMGSRSHKMKIMKVEEHNGEQDGDGDYVNE